TNDLITCCINSVNLKNRLGDIETNCRDRLHVWLLRIVGALTAPTSMALACRWRSRPQHQKRTYAAQQKVPLFDHLVGAQLEFTADRKPKRLRSLEIDERGQLCPIAIAGIVAASSALMNICYGGRVMAMKIDRIQPAGMNVRIQQGKPAYSHVVTV